jgi:hypothetical protein
MDTLIACLSIVLVAFAWAWSIRSTRTLTRKIHRLEQRVSADRRVADDRADVAEGRYYATVRRIGEIAKASKPCRRIHAGDLPMGFVRAPTWRDEDEVNSMLR